MDANLLRALVDGRFFTPGIEVDAIYYGSGLNGLATVTSQATFTILAHRFIGDTETAMEGANVIDGTRRIIYARSLVSISGMDPIRFAESCGIDANGEKIKEGKRRGRKPKNRLAEAIVIEDEDEEEDEDFNFLPEELTPGVHEVAL